MTVPLPPPPPLDDAPQSVSVLGTTGSVGRSALDVLMHDPARYRVEALVAGRDVDALAAAARRVGARRAVIAEPSAYRALQQHLSGSGIAVSAGPDAVIEAAAAPCDITVAAISGAAGLAPTLAALTPGRRIALANKECLVSAGELFMRRAAEQGAVILPVDSEHSAVFQGLMAGHNSTVERITLTASGGPFRTWSTERIARATVEDALCHPNWSMGPKITIDSATMMNKGLELIEAHHLFALPPARLDVLVHPQSIIHALVAFHDGSVMAQMAVPDMRLPVALALAWPHRRDAGVGRLDLATVGQLTFEAPDERRFPALRISREALRAGGGAPTIMNAANEVAVAGFLQRQLTIPALVALVAETISQVPTGTCPSTLEAALALDAAARTHATRLLPEIAAKTH